MSTGCTICLQNDDYLNLHISQNPVEYIERKYLPTPVLWHTKKPIYTLFDKK